MATILLVSENRKMLKLLYGLIEGEKQHRVHIVPYSSNTYERVAEKHADIIILDGDAVLPYGKTIEMLRRCPWAYRVILLCGGKYGQNKDHAVIGLNKAALTKEILLSAINEAQRSIELSLQNAGTALCWNGEEKQSAAKETSYILFAKSLQTPNTALPPAVADALKKAALQAGAAELFLTDGADVLFSVKKKDLIQGFDLAGLGGQWREILGDEYACMYFEDVYWSYLEDAHRLMEYAGQYAYFFKNETAAVPWAKKTRMQFNPRELQASMAKVLEAVLNGRENEAVRQLQILYLHTIKPGKNIAAVKYVRAMAEIIQGLILKALRLPPHVQAAEPLSAEGECAALCKAFAEYCMQAENSGLTLPVKKMLCILFANFQDDVSLDSIAAELNASKVYLSRIFGAQTGSTLVETMQFIRMGAARFLLAESSLKIGRVSVLAGYSDPGYFARVFKSIEGVTPEQYRKKIWKGGTPPQDESIIEAGEGFTGI